MQTPAASGSFVAVLDFLHLLTYQGMGAFL
jgi:hypothetical protein